MLSGHTHDAQLSLFGWSPASRMFPEHAGLYTEQGEKGVQSLYVNVGWGCTFPARVGVDAEITVIELNKIKN
jgi:predicted MPP superfamily phosphohydrolase